MIIKDDIVSQIIKALESSNRFLGIMAAGDGFDHKAFRCFMEELELCRDGISDLPVELRNVFIGLLEIPMLMRNAIPIVGSAEKEILEDSIMEVEDLFSDLFSSKSEK